MARTKTHNEKIIQKEVRKRVERQRIKALYSPQMSWAERVQHEASEIVRHALSLKDEKVCGWAMFDVGQEGFIALAFKKSMWTLTPELELLFTPRTQELVSEQIHANQKEVVTERVEKVDVPRSQLQRGQLYASNPMKHGIAKRKGIA